MRVNPRLGRTVLIRVFRSRLAGLLDSLDLAGTHPARLDPSSMTLARERIARTYLPPGEDR
jgi:hypothetical protein